MGDGIISALGCDNTATWFELKSNSWRKVCWPSLSSKDVCDAEREEIKHLKNMASFPPSVIAHN
jgi:hypothetical protein